MRGFWRRLSDYISIGDYVLTGGELPAVVVVDAVSRMVPGVLSNRESGRQGPSRTVCWSILSIAGRRSGMTERFRRFYCPEIIRRWMSGRQQSLLRTKERRLDLLKTANLTEKDKKYLNFEYPMVNYTSCEKKMVPSVTPFVGISIKNIKKNQEVTNERKRDYQEHRGGTAEG